MHLVPTARPALSLVSWVASVVVATSGCLALENAHRVRDVVEVRTDLAYIPDRQRAHRFDLYLPGPASRPAKSGGRARGAPSLVVFVHGGNWRAGDKAYWTPFTGLYTNVGVALAELSVATAVVNYRLFPETTLDGMLDDIVASLRFLQTRAEAIGVEPGALLLVGHSAGAHLVTYLATHPDALEERGFSPDALLGVVGISGVYDLVAAPSTVDAALANDVILPLFGADPVARERASPLFFMSAQMVPTLFLVGEHDLPGCRRDFVEVQRVARARSLEGAHAFFRAVGGNSHEEMVLEIGTIEDHVAPAIAAFADMRRKAREEPRDP